MKKTKYSPFGIPRYCCFAGGGTAQPADPAPADPAPTGPTPAEPAPKPAPTDPAQKATKPQPNKTETTETVKGTENTFTAEQLETAKKQAASDAVDSYKKHLEEAKDFEKMTDAEKVIYLQKQMADEKLTDYTSKKLSESGLPIELANFAKGTDEKNTDERVKALKNAFDKGVQSGVEQRFKANGYVPKGKAAGKPGQNAKKRERGVTVK